MAKERIFFNKITKKWMKAPENWKELQTEGKMITLNLHKKLREKCDNITKIINKGWDAVVVVDGPERSGKSTLGISMAWYLSNEKITIENFAAGMEDAAKKIQTLPDKSILLVDEGSLVFNSKESMKSESIKLQKVLDVVGQKNMIFIVILPSYFDLNKNVAIRRSKFLLHVYPQKDLTRGRFCYFGTNKKRVLYEIGKKNYGGYTKPKANWLGDFDDFHAPFDEEYIRLKKESLRQALATESIKSHKITFGDVRALFVQRYSSNSYGVDYEAMAQGFGVSKQTLMKDLDKEIPEKLKQIFMATRKLDMELPDEIPKI